MQTRAVFFTAPQAAACREVSIPDPGPGEVLVANACTGISPGTELRCLSGRQDGAPAFPFVPGYSAAGTVVASGPGVSLAPGTRVFHNGTQKLGAARCWGGHTAHAVVDAAAAIPLPESVSFSDAAILRLAGIAAHGVCLARPAPGGTVAVVGLGPIGQLSARIHAAHGARVVAADLSPLRRHVAAKAGIETVDPRERTLRDAFAPHLPDGADIIVDATGVAAVCEKAMELAHPLAWDDSDWHGSRFVLQGSYPGQVAFDYHAAFHRELTILVPRSDQPRDVRHALELLASGRLTFTGLVSGAFPPEEAPDIYRTLREDPDKMLTAVFAW